MRGKRATKADAWTDRDSKDLRRLLGKKGRQGLIHRIDEAIQEEAQRPPPKLGAPRKDFFKNFSVIEGPKDHYVVHIRVDNTTAPTWVVAVRRGRRVTPGLLEMPMLHQAMRKVAEYALEQHPNISANERAKRLGARIEAITDRLEREVRKASKSQK
jgi:hypothetical protein